MKNWDRCMVLPHTPVLEVIKIIDIGALQIALVVDESNKLLGTVTDGDIRRAILRGVTMNDPVRLVMNKQPTTAGAESNREANLVVLKQKKLRHLPILDNDRRVIGLETIDELLNLCDRDNWVVIMAGGLGTRLSPLTEECPKPLLKIGSKPILETILENFMNFGFRNFYISVNYRAEMIKDYFGDGSRWGLQIRYLHEEYRMGTAGALSLLPQKPCQPILVMNGDLLTKVNFQQLLDFHQQQGSSATMCVREYDFQVPYGVVKVDRHRLLSIDEKPIHKFFVSAGIYVLNPEALNYIPQDEFFDMPTLFQKLIDDNHETAVFPIREYWIDIGHMRDFEKANGEFLEVFK